MSPDPNLIPCPTCDAGNWVGVAPCPTCAGAKWLTPAQVDEDERDENGMRTWRTK